MRTIRNAAFLLLVIGWLVCVDSEARADSDWAYCDTGSWTAYFGLEITAPPPDVEYLISYMCAAWSGSGCQVMCAETACGGDGAGDAETETYWYCRDGGCGAQGDTYGCRGTCQCEGPIEG